MTWLLVEDDTDIRNFVQAVFMMWGIRPLVFPDGRAAWQWLDSVERGDFRDELPALALMDIRMPGYTGDQLAARLRQIEALRDIPIVLMTAFELSEAEVNDLRQRAGFDHLIKKPLPELDTLRDLLTQVAEQRKNVA